jgi:hypothetical protein
MRSWLHRRKVALLNRDGTPELPAPRFPDWLDTEEIASFDVSGPQGHNAAWEVLRKGMPAVLRKGTAVAALLDRWTIQYLASAILLL